MAWHNQIRCHLALGGNPLCAPGMEDLFNAAGTCSFPSLAKARRAAKDVHALGFYPSIVPGICPRHAEPKDPRW